MHIRTTGDRIQDVPLAKIGDRDSSSRRFEEALLDVASTGVHSVKDLPSELPNGLSVGTLGGAQRSTRCPRCTPWIEFGDAAREAVIGTSSLRRRAQLLHWRPDLAIVPMRGNVDTRLRKLETDGLDGIVVAAAGLMRMGWEGRISESFRRRSVLRPWGQGALGVEMRSDDEAAHTLFQPLTCTATQAA